MRQVEWKRVFSLCGVEQRAKLSASLLEDVQEFLVIWERNKKSVEGAACTYGYIDVQKLYKNIIKMWVLVRCTGLPAASLCPHPQIYFVDSPSSPSFSLNPHQWAQTAKFGAGVPSQVMVLFYDKN